jgi:hypothetical protein
MATFKFKMQYDLNFMESILNEKANPYVIVVEGFIKTFVI